MQPGDKVYRCWNGEMEEAIVVSVGPDALSGATAPTLLVKYFSDDRQKWVTTRCSMNFYQPSERAAWEKYLKECHEAIPSIERQLKEAQDGLAFAKSEAERVEKILATK